MAANESSRSTTDTRHYVEWLDEQRQLDHERLLALGQAVDQLRQDLRSHGSALSQAESQNVARTSVEQRSNVGVAVNLGDQIIRLERMVEEHISRQTQTSQAENASRERDRRQLADVSQQVDQLVRSLGLATGRVSALSEEIRHERDSRAPILHEIEEIQRIVSGTGTRIAAMEQMVRRIFRLVTIVETIDEKLRADLARVDNQVKLIDLRVTREFTEIQSRLVEWRSRVDEQIKPVDGLTRQVGQYNEQREATLARVNLIAETFERVSRDLSALDIQSKSDRVAIQRGAESVEALTRRIEAAGSSIWQVGERISSLVEDVDVVRQDVRSAHEAIEAVRRQSTLADDNLHVLESTQANLAIEVRTLRTDTRGWSDGIEARLDKETEAIVSRAESRYRLSVDQLRRSAEVLTQQVRELEADLT